MARRQPNQYIAVSSSGGSLVPYTAPKAPLLSWPGNRSPARNRSGNRSVAAYDSGQVTAYRPSQHTKPAQQGFIRSIVERFIKAFGRIDPSTTTEQGAAAAASPSTYELSLFQQRYERREKIADCRQMVIDDPRARRSTIMFAAEAVRGGFTIIIDNNDGSLSAKTLRIAQDCAGRVQDLQNPKQLDWAWPLILEGDLFVQAAVAGDEVVKYQRMPTSAMERLSDDCDEIIDPVAAFEQVDVATNESVATFCLALMHQERWRHIDGERYGEPEAVAGRKPRRTLELQETSQVVRRAARATQRVLFGIGNAEYPGAPDAVDNFKEQNGFIEGNRELMDPNEISRDLFHNGLISAQVLDADAGVSDVADIEYQQNVYASAALPTPPSLYNLGAKDTNRDVLEDQRAEWLKQTALLSESMERVARFGMDLSLLLKGIVPETVNYTVHYSTSTIEKPSEIVGYVDQAHKGGYITNEHAIQMLADVLNIEDPTAMAEQVKIEQQEKQAQALAMAQAKGAGQQGQENPNGATSPDKDLRPAAQKGHDLSDEPGGYGGDDPSDPQGIVRGRSPKVSRNRQLQPVGGNGNGESRWTGIGQLAAPWSSEYGQRQ